MLEIFRKRRKKRAETVTSLCKLMRTCFPNALELQNNLNWKTSQGVHLVPLLAQSRAISHVISGCKMLYTYWGSNNSSNGSPSGKPPSVFDHCHHCEVFGFLQYLTGVFLNANCPFALYHRRVWLHVTNYVFGSLN